MDEPPLFLAAKADDEDRLTSLLESGVRVGTKAGPFQWTALHVAAGHNSVKAIRVLLYARADPSACATDLETPLHIAAQEGHEAAIRMIVTRQADVAATNAEGDTPLHVAVQHIGGKQSFAHITTLLALRADPSAKNDEGQDAFACATLFTNRASELHQILKNGVHGDSSGSSKAAEANSGPPLSEGEFRTAVIVAIKRGQTDCLRQLLKLVPSRVAAAESGLAIAAVAGHVEVVEMLAAAGGDIHARNLPLPLDDFREGEVRLPLLVAAARDGKANVTRWLLSKKCDPNVTALEEANSTLASLDGRSGPQWAATTNSSYWTPLMAASYAGSADVVRLLLAAKAELEMAAPNGKTARSLAHGHSEVTKLLGVRATLNARTSRAAKSTEGADGVTAAEDTRDLDELVRELGGGGAPKPKAAKRNKKKKAGPKHDQGTAEPAEASEADGEALAAAQLAPIGDNLEAAAEAEEEDEEEEEAALVDGAAVEEIEEERPRGVAHAAEAGQEKDEARQLRRRLREILAARAQLDAEELQILTRLDEMAGGGG